MRGAGRGPGLTCSTPRSPRRRRRKRPHRTAHLRSRASSGLWEQPRPGRHHQLKLAAPGPSTDPPPAAGSGRAGRAGARRAQRSGRSPHCRCRSARERRAPRAAGPSVHLGRAFGTPAPPSCSPEPRTVPDTCMPTERAAGIRRCRLPCAKSPQERPHQPWPLTCRPDTHLLVLSNPISVLDFL